MDHEWRAFLEQQGAQIDSDRVLCFSDTASELAAFESADKDLICDLSHFALLAVSGADAELFLQGQISNDVAKLSPHYSMLTAYCSPKGRMLACFRLFRRDNDYCLRMPEETLEATLKRLRMFVLRSKASLRDASNELLRIAIAGPNAKALLAQALGAAISTDTDNAVIHARGVTVLAVPGPIARFELYGDLETLRPLWSELTPYTSAVGADVWRLMDIRAGLPSVYQATSDAFVPQMANLDLLGGISFDKGCYVGQEIVARTHYLGKLKRRMYRLHGAGPTPGPGSELIAPQLRGEQAVGQIVDACASPMGGFEALAVIVIDCVENGTLQLREAGDVTLTLLPLPYALRQAA